MVNVFDIGESPAKLTGKSSSPELRTGFSYYELEQGYTRQTLCLPLNFIIFVLDGEVSISCNEFENRRFRRGEMAFMLRASAVKLIAETVARLITFHFDAVLAAYERHALRAFMPDAEKCASDFAPVAVPQSITALLTNFRFLPDTDSDWTHYNELKHSELFLLLRRDLPRDEFVAFLAPLIRHFSEFRLKVLDKYPQLEASGGGVGELADLVGMGRKNFDLRFREEFGVSPAQWLIAQKAIHLKAYLSEPGAKIADAMDRFHFNSPSHFNRFCRTRLNATPRTLISSSGVRSLSR